MRQTRQRTDLLELLQEVREFLTAQEIHALLNERGNRIGLATVYRNLGALTDQSLIDTMTAPSGELRYRACSTGHHHHLTCNRCGKSVELVLTEFESLCADVAREHGFSNVEHTVEIVGTCRACAAA